VLPYESLSSCASIDKNIKKRKYKRKIIIRKIKEKKKKRNINIDLAILPSHDRYSKTKGRKMETIVEEEEIKKEKSGVRE